MSCTWKTLPLGSHHSSWAGCCGVEFGIGLNHGRTKNAASHCCRWHFPEAHVQLAEKGAWVSAEPVRASVATCLIAFAFVLMGDINAVAEIISMFFMVTYGAICLVSFLEHMAADPSYRPTFRSHWSISLMGAVLCVVLMFGMNPTYATASLLIMVGIHAWVSRRGGGQKGMVRLFRGIIFQLQRALQLALQMSDEDDLEESAGWRPFVLAISPDTFKRKEGFDMVRWVAYQHGFGTYMHFIKGFLSPETQDEARRPIGIVEASPWKQEPGPFGYNHQSVVHVCHCSVHSTSRDFRQGEQPVLDGIRPGPS